MKKFLIFFCIIFIAVGVSGEFFDNYKNEYSKENQEFGEYRKRLNKEFQIYKDTLINEFKKYKDETNEYWKTAVTSNQKKPYFKKNYHMRKRKNILKELLKKYHTIILFRGGFNGKGSNKLKQIYT